MATADDYLRARRAAEEAIRNNPGLTQAQRVAANPEPWLQAAAVARGAAVGAAPVVEAVRQGLLTYLKFVNDNRLEIECIRRGFASVVDTIAAQVQANPELARTIQRALETQRQQTTTSASHPAASAAQPDPAAAAAQDLAEDQGFVELVDATREEIKSGDVPVPEELYDLGLDINEIYGFIAVYLALVIGVQLYEHPTLALAVDKVAEFYTFVQLIYAALAHRSPHDD